MGTNLAAKMVLAISGSYTDQKKPNKGCYPFPFEKSVTLTNGTGAGQATRAVTLKRTVAANSYQDIDLSAGLLDAFGNSLALAKVNGLIATAAATNDNEAYVGAGGSIGMWSLFGTQGAKLRVRPGGMMAVAAPDAAGYGVVSGSARMLRLTNPGAGLVTITLMVIGVAVADLPPPVAITLPDTFLARWNPGITFYNAGGVYLSNVNYVTLKPVPANTYYVKPGGNNGSAGTSLGTAFASLSTALGKTGKKRIIIDTSAGDYIMRNSVGWNNTQPDDDTSVEVTGPGRALSVLSGSVNAPTWEPVSGAIYKTTISAAGASSVIDLRIKDDDDFYHRQLSVGSQGAMLPGTTYHDGTDLFCWALDGRNLVGDQYMSPCSNSNNCRVPSANLTIHVDGLDFIGGAPLNMTATSATDPLAVFLNCTFQGSHNGNANDINILGPGRFYFYRCGAARAHRDGFNYHGNGFGSPKFYEKECWTATSGLVGPSDNATTSHEAAIGIRENGNYGASLNRTVADINTTLICMFGGRIAAPLTPGSEALAQQDTNITWMDGVTIEGLTALVGSATLYYRNMPAPVRIGSTEDTGTLLQWAA
jgi:hypothetical protein